MSKSKGGAIYPEPFIKRYGLDAMRYYMMRELPFGGDGLFAPDAFLERTNFDLANDFGNLLNRSVAMVNQYFAGEVTQKNAQTPFDTELEAKVEQTVQTYDHLMDAYKPADALGEVFSLISRANKYIDETTPWVLAKDPAQKDVLEDTLYHLVESLRIIGILLRPVMPDAAAQLFEYLNVSSDHQKFESRVFGHHPIYHVAKKVTPLFPRLDVEKELAHLKDSSQAKKAPKTEPLKDEILIDDFAKLDLRVGVVIACKAHENADRLLVSTVDLGEEKPRQIVSGIAGHYSPEAMVGKKVIVVANLKPVTLRGELSEGMLLAGSNAKALEVVELKTLNPGDLVK